MKKNAKRLAALLMILLLSVSTTAFASTVYSNVITVNAVERPEETIVPEATEAPEATEEPEATETPEATEAPAEEVNSMELLANVEVSVDCQVISVGDTPAFGDTIQLTAIVTGAEELAYGIVWEYRIGGEEAEWQVYETPEGEVNSVISFILTEENYTSEWRARVVLITPEMPLVEESVADESAADEPAAEPAAENPAPVVEEPVVDEPAPVVEEPAAEEPAADEVPSA